MYWFFSNNDNISLFYHWTEKKRKHYLTLQITKPIHQGIKPTQMKAVSKSAAKAEKEELIVT